MNIRITISEDKLEAYLTISGDKVKFPTKREVENYLAKSGIVYGLNESKLNDVLSRKEPVDSLIIARGKPAIPDESSILDWHIGLNDTQKPKINEKNRADFKHLQGFTFVHKGQKLVSKVAPDNVESGMTVTGESIPPNPEIIDFHAGDNTEISEDGSCLISVIDGIASWDDNKIRVEQAYHVRGNVDYHTGNIKYKGPIVIDGDVRSGFRVEATESIFIGGTVGAAHIYSQTGDITVTYGILGKNRAKILAGGSLRCGFVQDATVGVKEDAIINHYSINSTISAGGKIILAQNEGLIRGGSVTAELGITAREVGSTRNLYTELKLRSHSEHGSQKLLWEISKKRTDLMLRKSSLSNRLSFLKILEKGVDELSGEKSLEITKITDELERLDEKLTELDQKEIDFQKKASREALNREIKIFNNLYRNVRIDISGKEFYIDNPLNGVKIFRFKDDIVIESLADLEDQGYDIFVTTT